MPITEAPCAGREVVAEGFEVDPDILVLPLDDQYVVFSEDKQRLISLNATAGAVLLELQKGTAVKDLPNKLVANGLALPALADEWVQTTLEGLCEQGVFREIQTTRTTRFISQVDEGSHGSSAPYRPIHGPFSPVEERHYQLLGMRAKVRFGHAAQIRLVDSVIGHLATGDAKPVTLRMDIQAVVLNNGHLLSNVFVDGTAFSHASRLSKLGPIVKAALWQAAVNAHDYLFYIHAGVVASGHHCIILPASAGSGKSSLTAALVHSGFRYYSDEVVLIERETFLVPPLALAICCKESGWDLMTRYFPTIGSLPVHLREDGKVVRYVPPSPENAKQPALPVSHIFFPRYVENMATSLRPTTHAEALSRLLKECLATGQRLERGNVGPLVDWIKGLSCFDLTFSSLDEAVGHIRHVVRARN